MPWFDINDGAEREYFPGFRGRPVNGETMTFVYWQVDAGATLPDHNHVHEQAVHLLDGEFELTIDGETRRLTGGQVAVIPSRARHSGRAITACRIMDAFHPVREDYR
jgi:quercetin dioxygenase-like cupin family protein